MQLAISRVVQNGTIVGNEKLKRQSKITINMLNLFFTIVDENKRRVSDEMILHLTHLIV